MMTAGEAHNYLLSKHFNTDQFLHYGSYNESATAFIESYEALYDFTYPYDVVAVTDYRSMILNLNNVSADYVELSVGFYDDALITSPEDVPSLVSNYLNSEQFQNISPDEKIYFANALSVYSNSLDVWLNGDGPAYFGYETYDNPNP
jgi:hypothetical protein